jgi:hypothetical protein
LMRVYEMSDEVNEALLEKLYEDALENLQK